MECHFKKKTILEFQGCIQDKNLAMHYGK